RRTRPESNQRVAHPAAKRQFVGARGTSDAEATGRHSPAGAGVVLPRVGRPRLLRRQLRQHASGDRGGPAQPLRGQRPSRAQLSETTVGFIAGRWTDNSAMERGRGAGFSTTSRFPKPASLVFPQTSIDAFVVPASAG